MNRVKKSNFIRVLRAIAKAYIAASPDDRKVWIESVDRMCDLATWLRDHPDAVVFRCGCIWTALTMAAISQTWPMDCPKHRPPQFRPGQFLPFKP